MPANGDEYPGLWEFSVYRLPCVGKARFKSALRTNREVFDPGQKMSTAGQGRDERRRRLSRSGGGPEANLSLPA
jgi:hypothetical protein